MKLYQYKWKMTISTAPVDIIDDEGKKIGTVKRIYRNPWIRIFDFICFNSKYFVEYEVHNEMGQLVLQSKADPNPFTRRQFFINYYENDQKYQFRLIDKRIIDIVERTTFEFNGETFFLEKLPFEWVTLKVGNRLLARWNIPLKIPFEVKFELHDLEYEERVLFLIGIFHTYFYVRG